MAIKKTKTKTSSKSKVPKVVTPEVLEASDDLHNEANEVDDDEIIDGEWTNQSENTDHKSIDEAQQNDETALVTIADSALTSAQQDLLKQYIRDISKYALLSSEEEYKLAIKLKDTGDVEAARRLVTANLRLVVKIAMEYRSTYQNVMDLIQEGNVGLMKAVSKFDPAKGAKLSYYASWWIKSYILKYILDNFRLVRVGTTQAQKKLFFHLMKEKERLEAQGLEVGPKLLADKLQVREQDVREMEQRLSSTGAEMSLNAPIGDEFSSSKATHQDVLVDATAPIDETIETNELKQILKENLEAFSKLLKEKELAVFKERLFSETPKTLQEVADKFGLTRERARQIEAQVIDKLRQFYQKLL